MNIRYIKNIDKVLTESIQKDLLTKNIAVVGCGGQGGYILEYLIRLGVKSITYWDGDIYSESNLNRQIGCTEKTIGLNKVDVLTERLKEINSTVELYPKNWFFGDKDSDLDDILKTDIIFMAVDCYYNVAIFRLLLREAIILGIPVIDCPITFAGGYVRIETKNDLEHYDTMTNNMCQQKIQTNDVDFSQSAYKCALIAAEAVNQMVLYFSNIHTACIDTHMDINIYHHKYTLSDRFGIV